MIILCKLEVVIMYAGITFIQNPTLDGKVLEDKGHYYIADFSSSYKQWFGGVEHPEGDYSKEKVYKTQCMPLSDKAK